MVIVHVHDPRFRRYRLGDLVDVIRRRNAGADTQELPDPRLARQETHRPAKKCPVRTDPGDQVGRGLQGLITDCPVSGEVVFPAEQVAIYPSLVRDAGFDDRRLVIVGKRAFEEAVLHRGIFLFPHRIGNSFT
jgi:hypothetical protein